MQNPVDVSCNVNEDLLTKELQLEQTDELGTDFSLTQCLDPKYLVATAKSLIRGSTRQGDLHRRKTRKKYSGGDLNI